MARGFAVLMKTLRELPTMRPTLVETKRENWKPISFLTFNHAEGHEETYQ